MPTTSKPPKHPRHMTTEEAINHLFHPEVIEHLKNQKNEPEQQPLKKE